MAKKKEVQEESLEKQLWNSADKLRKNIDAAEYKAENVKGFCNATPIERVKELDFVLTPG